MSTTSVDPAKADGTLLVKIDTTDMRIVSGAARLWGGVMAGSSFMNLDISLIDAKTHQVLRKKQLSSHNNAFGAAWTSGDSDKSLPEDMGKIAADYIDSVTL